MRPYPESAVQSGEDDTVKDQNPVQDEARVHAIQGHLKKRGHNRNVYHIDRFIRDRL